MTGLARVFVNGVGLDVPGESSALDAVRRWSAAAADEVARGASVITDSRGLPAPAEARVHGGAIYRVIPARSSRPAPAGSDSTGAV